MRPRKYDSPEEFDAMVDKYVMHCREEERYITWTGLALFLGFASRQSIDEYSDYDGFSDSVKRAKAIVEDSYEQTLRNSASSGSIFALKNMGWKDTQDHSSSDGSMKPTTIVLTAGKSDNSDDNSTA